MPTPRKRTRNRTPDLTPAQRQWLTGEPQKGANQFELLDLEYPQTDERLKTRARLLKEHKSMPAADRLRLLLKDQELAVARLERT